MRPKDILENFRDFLVFLWKKADRSLRQEKLIDYVIIRLSKNKPSREAAERARGIFSSRGLSGKITTGKKFCPEDIYLADLFVFIGNPSDDDNHFKDWAEAIDRQNKAWIAIQEDEKDGLLDSFLEHRPKKLVFIIPGTRISGGIMVIYQYARYLMKKGYAVSLVNQGITASLSWAGEYDFPIIPYDTFRRSEISPLEAVFATHWSTVEACLETKARRRFYLVQNKEYGFYRYGSSLSKRVKDTYRRDDLEYLTVSHWCQRWLRDEFGREAEYIPNGIDSGSFRQAGDRTRFSGEKVRILVEGNPADFNKNVDEAFRITNKLDKEKFEVWFVSYGGHPASWYRFDKFFQAVPHTRMPEIYSACDILLKTSILESFSYPPLEMMACGGFCVVAENDGNREYVKDGYNALTYQLGDLEGALSRIMKITQDEWLRRTLVNGGYETVRQRGWENSMAVLERMIKTAEV